MTRAVTCPGCKQQITLNDPPEVQENIILRQQIEDKKNTIQSFIPAYNCPDGNCGEVHKNRNYRMRPKGKCENCGQFARNETGTCPWCGHDDIEPIEDDELDDLDIPKATAHHNYHE